MKIPKKVKIGSHIYKILFPYTFRERSDVRGLAHITCGRIMISNEIEGERIPNSRLLETLIHEVLHIIASDTTGNPCLGGDEDKHTIVASAILHFLRENNIDWKQE